MKGYGMKHFLTRATLIFVVGAGGVLARDTISKHQEYFESKVKKQISLGVQKGKLSDLTDFAWEKACVILPYGVGVEKSAGVKIDVYAELPWTLSKTYWGILLIGTDGRFTAIQIDRLRVVDFDKRSVDGACYSKSSARFEIVTTGKRSTMLVVGSGT